LRDKSKIKEQETSVYVQAPRGAPVLVRTIFCIIILRDVI